ncbi:MAG: hypothetical protein U1E73_08930 [Planctomycetota bacterium]
MPALAQTGQNINHALLGTATQSADHPTYPMGVASRVVDGNRNGAWVDNSSNITAAMAAPWWQVVLAAPHLVHEIVIYPRADNPLGSMRDMLVELKSGSTVVWSQWLCTGGAYPPPGVATRLLLPPGGLTGDAVRISRPNETNGVISLAEVEVLQIAPIPPTNWAIYGTATMYPGGSQNPASNAIDGNTDSYQANNSCAMTSVNGATYSDWWEVTLPRNRYDEVKIWFSTWNPPPGPFYVRTFDGATTVATIAVTTATVTGPTSVPLPGGPYVDRVRVLRNSFPSPLVLAEVEVFNYSLLDAEARPFGIGCLGTVGVPALRATTPPQLTSHFDVSVANVPSAPGLAVIATGFSYTAFGASQLPLNLAAFGAAGCQAYVSPDITQFATATGGVATSALAIPNHSGLLGVALAQQAVVFDTAANPLGVTTSNALRVRMGF